MSAPDIRRHRVLWHGGVSNFEPVDDEKLKRETLLRATISDPEERLVAIMELIEAVRQADSDQSCGCM